MMDCETECSLPILDFSEPGLRPGTSHWDLMKQKVRRALEEYGCFEALYTKVPLELRKATFCALNELFDLPLEVKQKHALKMASLEGYIGQYPTVPLYEAMGVNNASKVEIVESFSNVFWPQGNPNFSNIIHSFAEEVSMLDEMVRRMILESLGIERYYDEHLKSTSLLLRVMKYKGPHTQEKAIGINPHKDKNMLTILHQNQVDGLEVQTKFGDWIRAKPSQDSFILMVGECLHAWTNGRLYPPKHRVTMSGNEARYSVGLFSVPKEGYLISAPPELVDEEHPLLYKPFEHMEYLKFFYTQTGDKANSALQTYCGV